MPLIIAPEEKELEVIKILAEKKKKKHLESLGITIRSKLKILSRGGGSVICCVKEGRLALDKNLATKIIVAAQ